MLLLVIIKHVSQNVLGVLQPLSHFSIVAIQCLVQRHSRSFTLLVHIRHVAVLRVQQDLSVVLEVNLHNLVTESEHDGMLGSHPFFDINGAGRVLQLVSLIQFVSLNKLFFFLRIVVLLQV